MTISEKGLNLIKTQEGLVLHPYLDQVGVPTIGYGTTRYPIGKKVTMGDPAITQGQAEIYLKTDVMDTEEAVSSYVTSQINQNQFDALVSFAYNVGTGGLHGSTLLKRVNANPQDPAIRDAFMMWDKGHVDGQLVELPVLKARRKDEADLYFQDI